MSRTRRPGEHIAVLVAGLMGMRSWGRLLVWATPVLLAAPLAGSMMPVQATSTTCASAANKCALVNINPISILGGSPATFTVSLTNEASTQQLGSADVAVPAGLPIESVVAPAGVSADFVANLIELRNLDISPGGSRLLTVYTSSAPCSAGPLTWVVQAKQSNNFQGPPGNAFAIDSSSALITTVIGGCHLAFRTEPADSQRLLAISSVAAEPTGLPIEVEVENSENELVPLGSLSVSLSITPGSGTSGAALEGTTTALTSAGIAVFAYPSIGLSGLAYTLTAQSSGIQPATSTAFDIDDLLDACTPGAICAGSDSNGATSPQGDATSTTVTSGPGNGSSADVLGLSIGVMNISCQGYNAVSATVMSDLSGSDRTATISLEIGKALVDATPNDGAAFYQVCFESSLPFTPRGGGPAVTLGLLPDCSSTTPAPCVVSRNKTNAGIVVITFTTPAGDPFYRG